MLKVTDGNSPYYDYIIRNENILQSMDSLFTQLKEDIEIEYNMLEGFSKAKYEYYTIDELSPIRLETKKNKSHKVIPDYILKNERKEFLKSFDSEYKVDKARNFLRKFTDRKSVV